MPATSRTVPPALKMLKLKVAADNGCPALLVTSRPGQANFGPECDSRKCSTGPNEVTAKSATTIRYGAKAINASFLPSGPEAAESAEPLAEPPVALSPLALSPPEPAGPTFCSSR